jgi:hypothetical protein
MARLAAAARFLGGGALSVSRPFASRFLRLSRLFRFARASPCTEALLPGAGEEREFRSDSAPLRRGPLLGGIMGEFILDEGADEPGA